MNVENADDDKFYLGIINWYIVGELDSLSDRSKSKTPFSFLACRPATVVLRRA